MDERLNGTHRNRIRRAFTCLAVVGLCTTVLHSAEASWPGQKDLMIVKAKGGQFGARWDNLKLRNAMVFVTGPGFQPATYSYKYAARYR
ncbi:MAG: hypothetical protein WCC06_11270 [Candidatus Aminicenantales bacterium]